MLQDSRMTLDTARQGASIRADSLSEAKADVPNRPQTKQRTNEQTNQQTKRQHKSKQDEGIYLLPGSLCHEEICLGSAWAGFLLSIILLENARVILDQTPIYSMC